MSCHEHVNMCECPSSCFCKFDAHELLEVGRRKFIQHIPTLDLMKAARSPREKEIIRVVSLLDLNDYVAQIMIREKMVCHTCDVLACRADLKKRLFGLLHIDSSYEILSHVG